MDDRRRSGAFTAALLGAATLVVGLMGPGTLNGEIDPDTRTVSADSVQRETLATWNMQGGSSGRDSSWTTGVGALARQNSIVALQEAGPDIPPSATDVQTQDVTTQDPATGQNRTFHVRVGRWSPSNRSGGDRSWVYFLPIDEAGHRVNLAMVTRERASAIVVVPPIMRDQENSQPDPQDGNATIDDPTADPQGEGQRTTATDTNRPMLGLVFGDTIYYTLHARAASHGRDAPEMLRRAAQTATDRARDWVVLGDFNRSPESMGRDMPRAPQSTGGGSEPIGRIWESGQATHFSGGRLDYMVTNVNLGDSNQYQAQAQDGGSSDHIPVTFRSLFGSVNDSYSLFYGNSSVNFDGNNTPGIGQTSDPEDYYSIPSAVGAGSEMVVDRRDGECVADTGSDDKMVKEPCDTNDSAQAFSVEKAPSSNPDDFYFRNQRSRKCISSRFGAHPSTRQTPPYTGMNLGPCDQDAVVTYKPSYDESPAHPPVFKRDTPPQSDPHTPDSQQNQPPPVQPQPEQPAPAP